MGTWPDLAVWRGPTPNCGPALAEHRGLVVHIAEGTFEGTISWCKNPASNVGPHFVAAKDGRIAQLVDTGTRSWCQQAGNATWMSVECEGHTPAALTDAQLTSIARLLARCHQVYGVPLQVASSPSGRGLGHHSMGADWGHQSCPGPAIIAQKPEIVARAVRLAQGGDGDDVGTLDGVDPYDKRTPQAKELRDLFFGFASGYQDDLATSAGVIGRLARIEAALARVGGPSDAQIGVIADRVAAALVARPDVPLTAASAPIIVAAVKTAMREGSE